VEETGIKTKEILDIDPRAKNLGNYLIEGGPGRPPGLRNKFTQLKETLLDIPDFDRETGWLPPRLSTRSDKSTS
jgi:hypothetical protein